MNTFRWLKVFLALCAFVCLPYGGTAWRVVEWLGLD